MLFLTSIFVLVFSIESTSIAFDLDSANGRSLRGQTEAKLEVESNSTSLKALGSSCKCAFSGLCSCVQALEFMKCIRDACDSGACDCQKHHYFYACHSMSAECPKAELQCGVKESSCKKVPPMVTESAIELVADVEVMQARKCKLKQAVANGFINGKVRLAEMEPEMQDRTDELQRKGIETPQLGCTKKEAESFREFKLSLNEQMEREEAEANKKQELAEEKQKQAEEKQKQAEENKKKKKKLKRKHVEVDVAQNEEQESSGKEGKEEVGATRSRLWKKEDSPWRGEEDMPDTDAELADRVVVGGKVERKKAGATRSRFWKKEDSPWKGEEDMPDTDAELADRVASAITGSAGNVPSVAIKSKDPAWFTGRPLKSMLPANWTGCMFSALINIAIAAVCALIYDKYRASTKLPFAPKTMTIEPRSRDDFGVGLFSCFSDIKLTLFALCCPCLRWADTLDRAGLLKYWVAFTVFAVLLILSPCTFGISGLALAYVGFRYRQKLRKKYNMGLNNGQDVLTYLCCSTCAVIQEARVEANRVG